MPNLEVLKLENVSKIYHVGLNVIRALNNISLSIKTNEFVAIMGPSGSGKSTFLQVASMLAEVSQGKILLDGNLVTEYNEKERAFLRNKKIGFVFQQFNLLARTSALDNVGLPLIYSKNKKIDRKKRSLEMLKKFGLEERMDNTPAQLSGGQQQRVAIARALINNPSIIFADEPTGNLDSKSGHEIEEIFKNLHQEGKTIIVVTHDPKIASIAKRLVVFKDGQIETDQKIKNLNQVYELAQHNFD
jgi:putative ABC transport system ATP-binding protein